MAAAVRHEDRRKSAGMAAKETRSDEELDLHVHIPLPLRSFLHRDRKIKAMIGVA